jgi:hypothetical protein
MTAPVATSGSTKTRRDRRSTATGDSNGHPRALRRTAAPRRPRRVSGPARGRPDRRVEPTPSQRLRSQAGAFLRSLPDHPLLDRIVRGRSWIPLLGVLLVGIVAMQVEVLKLGASIGRSLERASGLQSTNQQLRANLASLADDQRIERIAAGMGMVMPAPEAIGFISTRPGDAGRAVANIHAPDPSGFLSSLTASDSPATGTGASGATGTTASAATGTTASAPTEAATATQSSSTQSSATQSSATQSSATQSSATQSTPQAPVQQTQQAPVQQAAVPPSSGQSSGG